MKCKDSNKYRNMLSDYALDVIFGNMRNDFNKLYPRGYAFEYNINPGNIRTTNLNLTGYYDSSGYGSGCDYLSFDGCLSVFGEEEMIDHGLDVLYPSYGHDTPLDLNIIS